nr:MAG TPA: hypothetical protein [Caudoviricetes sp.]
MKNKLVDLNNHLFEQLERLNDDDLSDAELEREMKRSRAMAGIASNIVANAQLALDSQKFIEEQYGYDTPKRPQLPEMLETKE